MDIVPKVSSFMGKYAVAVVKRNPGLVTSEIKKRFVAGISGVTELQLIEGAQLKTDLIKFLDDEDKEMLRGWLRTKQAREI